MTQVKICGVRDVATAMLCAHLGVDFIGLVFYSKSPRNIDFATAADIIQAVRGKVQTVAVTVNPDDTLLKHIAALQVDFLQLHGSEGEVEINQIKTAYGFKIIKAIPIRDAVDAADAAALSTTTSADYLLLDAKPAAPGIQGGSGEAFDWNLPAAHEFSRPWFLAGGLTPLNVHTAIKLSGAAMVDVSSGVESTPGMKDHQKIRDFIANSRDF